jgi:hypothetical protein
MTNTDLARSNSLADLATRIRAEHEATADALRRGLEHATLDLIANDSSRT